MSIDFETELRERMQMLAGEAVPGEVHATLLDMARVEPVAIEARARRAPVRVLAVAAAFVAVFLTTGVLVARRDAPRSVASGVARDTARWRTIATAPISGRELFTTVFTGKQLLVWGGSGEDTRPPDRRNTEVQYPRDGAVYDVATDRWKLMPAAPIGGKGEAVSVWTGAEMIVTGRGSTTTDSAVAAYNPARGTWRRLADAPTYCIDAATWDGTRLIALASAPGGVTCTEGPSRLWALDPAQNTWSALPAMPVNVAATAITTVGGRVVVWTLDHSGFVLADDQHSWTELPPRPDVKSMAQEVLAADGEKLLVLGSAQNGNTIDEYDFGTRTWSHDETAKAKSSLYWNTMTSVHGGLIAWVGESIDPADRGARPGFDEPGIRWYDTNSQTTGIAPVRGDRPDRRWGALYALGDGRYLVWSGVSGYTDNADYSTYGAIFSIDG